MPASMWPGVIVGASEVDYTQNDDENTRTLRPSSFRCADNGVQPARGGHGAGLAGDANPRSNDYAQPNTAAYPDSNPYRHRDADCHSNRHANA